MGLGERAIRNTAVGLLVRDGRVLAEEHSPLVGYHRFVRASGGEPWSVTSWPRWVCPPDSLIPDDGE